MGDGSRFVYVGSYTNDVTEYNRYSRGAGIGIYRIRRDGEWTRIQEVEDDNPCVLGFGRNQSVVYAANSPTAGAAVMGITCYDRDGDTGKLKRHESQLRLGIPMCCFAVHPSFSYMVSADFEGNLYVIALN